MTGTSTGLLCGVSFGRPAGMARSGTGKALDSGSGSLLGTAAVDTIYAVERLPLAHGKN